VHPRVKEYHRDSVFRPGKRPMAYIVSYPIGCAIQTHALGVRLYANIGSRLTSECLHASKQDVKCEGHGAGLYKLRKIAVSFALIMALAITLAAQGVGPFPDLSAADQDAIKKFTAEGLQDSHIMEIMGYLTDVYGPRLTNSPNIREAAGYAEKTLDSWGLANIHEEKWGPFGRGWSNEIFEANEISPRHFPLIAYPRAWSASTGGPITAEVVFAKIGNEDDFKAYRGKLRGKFVMTEPARAVDPHFEGEAHRFTDQELADLAQPRPVEAPPDPEARKRFEKQREFTLKLQKFVNDEGAVAWLEPSARDDGTIVVTGGDSRDPRDPPRVPRVVVAVEQYDRILRNLEKNIPVTLRVNAVNKYYDDNLDSFNIIAEIPGTDKPDETVMLGAHFDSWDAGTGATDNAAGSAVMMEAMRILKNSGLKMRRTVRLALWTGEEEGLLGSRAYVKEHFAEREKMRLKEEHARLSAYYNLDNGTGKIRGIYMQGNEELRPIFEKWMQPFKGLGMTTLSIRSVGGTDHLSFDEVGLPGFQFIQDPIDYDPRTHHTNMDVLERIQEGDLKQAAVIIASFVYLTANADQELPRKPLPKH